MRKSATHQAGEGVVHAVLQGALLQDGEQGGVVEAARRCGDQLLHALTLGRAQTCTPRGDDEKRDLHDLRGQQLSASLSDVWSTFPCWTHLSV